MTEIRTLRTATLGRYLVQPGSSPSPSAPMLVGFHGYGQNAETMLEALLRIPGTAQWTVISVQALHRFYNTKTHEIAGSWMTSQDREQAIEDNLAYVGRVLAELRSEGRTGKRVFAGFSQGAAMAWRAAARFPCEGLLVLGGDLPQDVIEAPALPPILIGRGDQDTYYTAVQLARDLETLETRGHAAETLTFDGGHEWGVPFLEAAGRFLGGLEA
ncbi:MAG TPA: hypothetical protein VJ505_08935 [Holophagaceae bacterium]|nr:hypothetical protein [Holophagaceae bacterium]